MGGKGDSAPISRGAEDSLNICPVFIFPKIPILDLVRLNFLLCIAWGIGPHRLSCFQRECQWVTFEGWALSLGLLESRVLA